MKEIVRRNYWGLQEVVFCIRLEHRMVSQKVNLGDC